MKRLLTNLLLLVFVLALIDLGSLLIYRVVRKDTFSFKNLSKKQLAIANALEVSPEKALFKLPIVMHPYLGFIHSPDAKVPKEKYDGVTVTEAGFFDDKEPLQKKSPDKLLVGVFGGSVSWWASKLGASSFVQELKKSLRFKDKEIVIIRLAIGAYKQPQQLMLLNYLLSLGAEFDIVINIDGFNEVTLPLPNYVTKGVHPFFPEYWFELSADLPNPTVKRWVGKSVYLEDRRRGLAAWISSGFWRYSVTFNTFWAIYDDYLVRDINELKLMVKNYALKGGENIPYGVSGPKWKLNPEQSDYQALAEMWQNSSRLMRDICEKNEIKYYHFLQPNQYIPNSKVLSAEEKEKAYSGTSDWKKHVELGYPELIKAGAELKKEGEQIYDFSMIFKDISESLYTDDCCHFNLSGNELFMREVARAIADQN